MLSDRAFWTAIRKRAFASGSAIPVRAATVISLASLVKSCPRLASAAPFLRLIVDHLECPDMPRNTPGDEKVTRSRFDRKYSIRAWRSRNPDTVICVYSILKHHLQGDTMPASEKRSAMNERDHGLSLARQRMELVRARPTLPAWGFCLSQNLSGAGFPRTGIRTVGRRRGLSRWSHLLFLAHRSW